MARYFGSHDAAIPFSIFDRPAAAHGGHLGFLVRRLPWFGGREWRWRGFGAITGAAR